MKLSDIKGDRVLDVVADLIDPIASIAQDVEATELFRVAKVPDGMTAGEFTIARIKRSLPALLKKHKGEIIYIMATINGVDESEYAEGLTIVSLMKDVNDMVSDPAFVQLFR